MDEIVNQNETSTMSTTSTSTTTTTSNYSELKCQCYRLYIETMSMEIDQKLLDRLNRQQLQKRRTAIELLRQNDFNEIQKSLLTIDNLSNIDPIENDRSLQMLTTIGKSLNSMLTMIDLAIVDNINQQTTNINDNNNFQHQQQQQQQKELDERLELISQFGDNDDYDNNDDYSQISSMLNMNNNNKPMDCRSVDNNLDHLNDNHNNISMSMSNLNIATTNRVNSALLSFDELSNNHHDNYPGHSNGVSTTTITNYGDYRITSSTPTPFIPSSSLLSPTSSRQNLVHLENLQNPPSNIDPMAIFLSSRFDQKQPPTAATTLQSNNKNNQSTPIKQQQQKPSTSNDNNNNKR
ncbi:hypothetical protein HUG17_8591 [Dermatophagoides farinae]|uniref:Uncharacterized protein n=1 Tax=Dermatophagoides farinae TaxID=6954 RepID=A0A9D4NSZ5_DERFA|nr:hypothetical protein HUG17_8591 [Dermatophagoides farinae]